VHQAGNKPRLYYNARSTSHQDTETCRGHVIPLCIIIRNNQENLLIKKTYNSM